MTTTTTLTAKPAARVVDAVRPAGSPSAPSSAGSSSGPRTGASDSAFAVPPARLAIVALVGLVAGALAGLRPARRAARLDVLRVVATEGRRRAPTA
ncbi:predicted protein [Streptomyces viridochromogenes DSM 40736]|uniref:Predicted protein n=1 Tax=Streptomyces viridochromogenes (strain DSM 40736 / JCM 4977 / BCRC 1201 / Tue 494) TaxID=591159 RepID=D9XAM0_STRVT|nr:ABC transporter permease [Streptomyces viridochromogenes]EFL30157.1 predicted protein [Streptomyces viridochromogenes DSM 40736]